MIFEGTTNEIILRQLNETFVTPVVWDFFKLVLTVI